MPSFKLAPEGSNARADVITARAAVLFDVQVSEIRNPGRGSRALVTARFLVAHALRVELQWTLQEAADYLKRSGHDGVLTAVAKAKKLIETRSPIAQVYERMIAA